MNQKNWCVAVADALLLHYQHPVCLFTRLLAMATSKFLFRKQNFSFSLLLRLRFVSIRVSNFDQIASIFERLFRWIELLSLSIRNLLKCSLSNLTKPSVNEGFSFTTGLCRTLCLKLFFFFCCFSFPNIVAMCVVQALIQCSNYMPSGELKHLNWMEFEMCCITNKFKCFNEQWTIINVIMKNTNENFYCENSYSSYFGHDKLLFMINDPYNFTDLACVEFARYSISKCHTHGELSIVWIVRMWCAKNGQIYTTVS